MRRALDGQERFDGGLEHCLSHDMSGIEHDFTDGDPRPVALPRSCRPPYLETVRYPWPTLLRFHQMIATLLEQPARGRGGMFQEREIFLLLFPHCGLMDKLRGTRHSLVLIERYVLALK